eukprot:Platyproteum_vivax@DN7516_c0_g1_i1.p1
MVPKGSGIWWFSVCFAEFVCSMVLVVVATSSGIKVTDTVAGAWSAVPAGAIVSILAYSYGSVSGAHFNPCVSLGFFLRGGASKFSLIEMLVYWPFQFIGAICGGLFTLYSWGQVNPMYPYVDPPSWARLVCAELFWTAMLLLVIMSVATTKDKAGVYGALAIGCLVMVGGFSSNSANCLNPCVGMGISIAHMIYLKQQNAPAWKFTHAGKGMAFYIFIPFVGAVLGMIAFRLSRIAEIGSADLKPFIGVVKDEPVVEQDSYAMKQNAIEAN